MEFMSIKLVGFIEDIGRGIFEFVGNDIYNEEDIGEKSKRCYNSR